MESTTYIYSFPIFRFSVSPRNKKQWIRIENASPESPSLPPVCIFANLPTYFHFMDEIFPWWRRRFQERVLCFFVVVYIYISFSVSTKSFQEFESLTIFQCVIYIYNRTSTSLFLNYNIRSSRQNTTTSMINTRKASANPWSLQWCKWVSEEPKANEHVSSEPCESSLSMLSSWNRTYIFHNVVWVWIIQEW